MKINDAKVIAIVILSTVVVVMLGAIIGLKRTLNRQGYAMANDCTWVWQGTAYGDDRDYICK